MRRQAKASSSAGPTSSWAVRLTNLLIAPLCAFVAALALLAAPASAGTVNLYRQASSFDGAGTPAGTITPSRMAFYQSTETLYVFDTANGGVVKFDSSGAPQNFSALASPVITGAANSTAGFIDFQSIAVDNSGGPFDGDIYVADRPGDFEGGRISVFGPDGGFLYEFDGVATPTGLLGAPSGLAIDSAGAIYVAGAYTTTARKFIPTASPLGAGYDSEFAIGGQSSDLAVDSSDSFYGNFPSTPARAGRIAKFDSTGAPVSEIATDGNSLAVNPSTDRLFVNGGGAIAEYDTSGAFLSRFGSGTIASSRGVAVDGANGEVYVADAGAGIIRVFARGDVTVPDTTIGAVSALEASSATLKGTIDPLGVPTSFHFEYRRQGESEWTSTAEDSSLDSGGGAQAASAAIAELKPATSYEVRLVAANTEVGAANGAILISNTATFTTKTATPILLTSPATVVGASTAGLYAGLVPNGPNTTYHFEYGTDASYGTTMPIPDGNVGGGPNDFFNSQIVSESLSGLASNTTYHFRLVVTNSAGTIVGPDRTFTTLGATPSQGLPDGRVYERVSPQDKNGGDVSRENSVGIFNYVYQASTSGDAIVWPSWGNFAGEGGPPVLQYISRRSPSGWSTMGLTPRLTPTANAPVQSFYRWFSDDLSQGAVLTRTDLHAGERNDIWNLFVRNTTVSNDIENNAFQLLTSPLQPPSPESGRFQRVVDSSSDGNQVLFESEYQLTPDGQPGLYEWKEGAFRYVDSGGAGNGLLGHGKFPGFNAMSNDGSRIFSTTDLTLSVIENGVKRKIATGGTEIHFRGAKASDGAIAFLTSPVGLTDDASEGQTDCEIQTVGGQTELGCPDLYRWDANAVAGSELTDLTTSDRKGAGVLGVVGLSDDATKLYFAALGDLAPGAVRGRLNLYLWQQGKGTKHIATLSDNVDAQGAFVDNDVFATNLLNGEEGKFGGARVTPNGEHLLFVSSARLTSYDNAGHRQVYLYSLSDDEITCLSCNDRTTSSQHDSYLSSRLERDGYLATTFLPRNLSEDGTRVIFETAEPLVSRDTNGKIDVYEWEDGRVHLISSGQSSFDSTFMGASDSGGDLFFATQEPLVRSDGDTFYDLYDARVGGTSEPAPIPGCSGDECQGVPTAPPSFNDPGTSGLNGPGNPRLKAHHKKHHKKGAGHRKRGGHQKHSTHRQG